MQPALYGFVARRSGAHGLEAPAMGEDTPQQTSAGWRELFMGPQAALAALLLLGVWLNAADALVTVAIMPSVARSIGGYAYFAWAAGAFMLGSVVACASGGYFAARVGLKRGLLVSGAVYAAGCALTAAAPDVGVFLAGRLMQGVGGGWVLALVFVGIGVSFPERLSTRLFSALAGVWGAATLVGPLIGGGFATLGLWRWLFWIFAAQAVLFVLGVALALKPDRKRMEPAPGVPLAQLALVALGILGVALAGVTQGLIAPVLGVAGIVGLGAAVAVDRGRESRILPRAGTDLNRPAGQGYAAIFFLSAASAIHTIYSPVLLQRIHGTSPLVAGYVVACEAVGWSLVALFVGQAPQRLQGRLIQLGASVVVIGLAALALLVGGRPIWTVALAAGVMGSGFGASFAFMTARVVEGQEGDERALASAAVPTLQYIGGSVGAAVAGVVAGVLGLGRPFDAATASAAALPLFAAFVPLGLLGALAAWRLGQERGKID